MSVIDPKNTWYIENNGTKYFTVDDACQALKDNFKDSYLYYYDDAFSKFDWSKEPEESFDELKRMRAQQLRDQYPYLRLYVSYASDSGTMLNTFVKHNIFVDEIVNYASIWQNQLTELEQERNTLFIPKIKEFIKLCPNTKITLKDVTANEVKVLLNHKNKNASGIVPSRHNISRMKNELDVDKNFVDVVGDQKPFVMIDKGNFYTSFPLPYVHDVISRGEDVEHFFTTPKFPKLHIKQCHMLKNKIKQEKKELIAVSYKHDMMVVEPGIFFDGTLMETFIELACRDFTDLGFAPLKDFNSYLVPGSIFKKDMYRIQGFYNADKQGLTDYIDYIKQYLNQPMYFKGDDGVKRKHPLRHKVYNLGR